MHQQRAEPLLACASPCLTAEWAGRAHIGEPAEASPYKGAKPCFLIAGERWENAAWLSDLMRVTAAELPAPVKKTARKRSAR